MRVLSWNIQRGGIAPPADLVSAIQGHDPEVVVLGEYMPTRSAPLVQALAIAGWAHQSPTSPPNPRIGGLAMLSREKFELTTLPPAMAPFASRFHSIRLIASGLEIFGIYGLLQKEPHDEFWTGALAVLKSAQKRDVLVVGDFNTGTSLIDSPAKNFFCSEYFAQLPSAGYEDLWRTFNGESERACTWHGPVHPYRLDHAFGSESVVRRSTGCRYSHREREAGLSDHSVLIVDL